jgi:NitT/TauT family transport system substrate-binding protein
MANSDDVIINVTGTRANRRDLMKRVAALGIAAPALSLVAPLAIRGTLTARAQAENKVTWVSPRGTLEVLDDYPYWVAVKMGYFGDIETEILPAIAEATSSSKAVAEGSADMSYVSPASSRSASRRDRPRLRLQMGAYDVFDIALQKGNPAGITTLKDLEGKTVVLGDLGWSSIVDPMVKQAGGDPTWSSTSRPVWPAGARRSRPARPTRLSPGPASGRSGSPAGSTSTTSSARAGRSSRPTPSRSAAPTSRTPP